MTTNARLVRESPSGISRCQARGALSIGIRTPHPPCRCRSTGTINSDADLLLPSPVGTITQPADRVVLSVVLPVKNGLPWLREQLKALTRQRCCLAWEIIVANNGSTDRPEELVKEFAANDQRITLVDASHVNGPAATRNVGAQYARGCILTFCDADDVVHPGWVESWVYTLAYADLTGGLFDNSPLNDTAPPLPPTLRPPPTRRQFGFLDATGSGNMAVPDATRSSTSADSTRDSPSARTSICVGACSSLATALSSVKELSRSASRRAFALSLGDRSSTAAAVPLCMGEHATLGSAQNLLPPCAAGCT